MSKKYYGNENTSKKIKDLKDNSTIIQRLSTEAILSMIEKIVPQLKEKIDNLTSKSPNIDKQKLIQAVSAILAISVVLLSGCSKDISNSARKLY